MQALPSLNDHVDVISKLRIDKKEKTKRWIIGQGIKPWPISKIKLDRKPKNLIWQLDTPFVEAKPWDSDLLIIRDDTIPLEKRLEKTKSRKDVLYSQPSSELFQAPMVLVNRGFENVAYCDFPVLFQHFLQSIAGPKEDSEVLIFLAAYLRSNVAKYFLFHTASNWGTEREYVTLNELLRVPFPLPGHEYISPDSEKIVKQVVQKFDQLRTQLQSTFTKTQSEADSYSLLKDKKPDFSKQWQKERKRRVDEFQEDIEPLICQYFGLTDQEKMLVEDTLRIFEPSSTPTTRYSLKTTTLDSLRKTDPYHSTQHPDELDAYICFK